MISVRQETERETALVDTLRPRISIFMETVMMIKLTRFQNQSQNCSEQWYESDGQEPEALISLRDARKKLQHATKSRRFYPKGGGRARSTGKSIEELKKVTSCNRCGAIGHWEEDCSQPATSRKKRSASSKGKGKSRRFRREKSDGKGRGGFIELPDCGGLQRWFENSNVTYEGSSWLRGSGLWCCQESVWSETCRSDGTDMCTRR